MHNMFQRLVRMVRQMLGRLRLELSVDLWLERLYTIHIEFVTVNGASSLLRITLVM